MPTGPQGGGADSGGSDPARMSEPAVVSEMRDAVAETRDLTRTFESPDGGAIEVLCGVDLRGHGRSPGLRGHIDGWEDYREDLQSFLQWSPTWEPARPRFVLGHSMGSLVVLDFKITSRLV